jgi:hypothetical protein
MSTARQELIARREEGRMDLRELQKPLRDPRGIAAFTPFS